MKKDTMAQKVVENVSSVIEAIPRTLGIENDKPRRKSVSRKRSRAASKAARTRSKPKSRVKSAARSVAKSAKKSVAARKGTSKRKGAAKSRSKQSQRKSNVVKLPRMNRSRRSQSGSSRKAA